MNLAPDTQRTRVAEGGRLVIPAEFRRALGLQPGATVVLDIADGALRVRSLESAVARAQALVRRYVPEGEMLSEELMQERRIAARNE